MKKLIFHLLQRIGSFALLFFCAAWVRPILSDDQAKVPFFSAGLIQVALQKKARLTSAVVVGGFRAEMVGGLIRKKRISLVDYADDCGDEGHSCRGSTLYILKINKTRYLIFSFSTVSDPESSSSFEFATLVDRQGMVIEELDKKQANVDFLNADARLEGTVQVGTRIFEIEIKKKQKMTPKTWLKGSYEWVQKIPGIAGIEIE